MDVNCPLDSFNLTVLDYFLWRRVKDKSYANNSQTVQDLKAVFHVAIAEVKPYIIKKRVDRMDTCQVSRHGRRLNAWTFK